MLYTLEIVVPSCVAIAILALFSLSHISGKSKKLCYVVSALCILAELAPSVINLPALAVCVAAFAGMFIFDKVHASHPDESSIINNPSNK